MKFGLSLRYDAGADAIIAAARRADEQGFDSVWLPDHLSMPPQFGDPKPDAPLDNFTLMTAIGAVTQRVRLAWSMLNPSFRNPAVMAKMLATLDVISHGRVIAALGAGNNAEEYTAYNLEPGWMDDHADRLAYGREVIRLLKELWTHPAPERVTFDGRFVRVHNLAFNPEPVQKPHPPIWVGGDSDASLETVKLYADGWVTLFSGPDDIARHRESPEWPDRPMTVVKTMRVVVDESRDAALEAAQRDYDAVAGTPNAPASFEQFVEREVIGDADACIERLKAIEAGGINYLRMSFRDEAAQDRVARLLIPRLAEVSSL